MPESPDLQKNKFRNTGFKQNDLFDGTLVAQKVLSAVTRLRERFGVTYVIDFLRGSKSEKIRPEHRELKIFGTGAEFSKETWIEFINELIFKQYLLKSDGPYPLLRLTAKSAAVLNGMEKVMMTESKETNGPAFVQLPQETELLNQLKSLRKLIANSENVPSYIVLSDATLTELATYLPHHIEEMIKISGFGEVKSNKYGKQFLKVVTDYCLVKRLNSRMDQNKPKRPERAVAPETKFKI